MCQIIVKEAGSKFNMKKLDKAQGWNEDGYGVSWWTGEELKTFVTMDYNQFKAILSTLKKYRAVAHLRNTTRGVTCEANNHPFPVPSGMMFHNGTIFGMECGIDGGSDTEALAKLISKCKYDVIEDILPFVQATIGTTINRLVFFDDLTGDVSFVNPELGQVEDNIWYSNDYHERATTRANQYTKVTKVTTYDTNAYSDYEYKGVTYRYNPEVERYQRVEKEEKKDATRQNKGSGKTKVFVYGTLKSGFSNHSYFLSNATKVGEATTVSKWAMIGEGMAFPYLLHRDNDNGLIIQGEVYEVDNAELANLDRLEGTPTHYKRDFAYVSYKNGLASENVMVYTKTTVTLTDTQRTYIGNFTSARQMIAS